MLCADEREGAVRAIPDTNFVNWLNANGFASCMSGNQMDTTCGAVMNATSIDCQSSGIFDLTGISYFDSLADLSCMNNNLTWLPSLPPLLSTLHCENNQLTWLPSLPPLILLSCDDNQLDSLPPLPNTLLELTCDNNQFDSLPLLPASLWFLYCNENHIASLPSLLPPLLVLQCSGNQLTSLPALPATIGTFYCNDNLLTALPPLPPQLTRLFCFNNPLTSLPTLQSTLQQLWCSDNQLTSLPTLPASLTWLQCYNNPMVSLPTLPPLLNFLSCRNDQLTSLPALPSSLTSLECSMNQLTSLPTLPSSLTYLYCNINQLTSLPAIPDTLIDLRCSKNQLSALPNLPDTMVYLYIDSNLNMSCMPSVKRITYFHWDYTNIMCLSNEISIVYPVPPIASLPECELINANNCEIFWNIKGIVFTDLDSDCLLDSTEALHHSLKLSLYKNGNLIQQTFSNSVGQYSFDTDTGTFIYTVDSTEIPVVVNCPASGFYTTTVTIANPFYYGKDFSVACKPGFVVGVTGVVNTTGRFRPVSHATINILAGDMSNHYNQHCAAGVSGTVTVVIDGPASFDTITAGALVPVVNGDTLVYTVADFGSVNFQNDFSFIVQTDTIAQVGQQVCFDVSVTPLTGDNNTANNNYSQCFAVTNSIDPNEKEVSPSGSIDTSQHTLTYTIYFQNTGNDTAKFVIIKDTLDNAIDESSIQLLAYSHESLVQVIGNVIKFNFPNINLPDSTVDEPNSHGYVQYRVRIKDNAVAGTRIHNTAYIYFDFNNPVVTNTTFDQIDITTNLTPALTKGEGAVCDIYPNPVVSGGELKIVFGAGKENGVLGIYDMSGRKVFEKSVLSSTKTQSINLPLLAAGVYECVASYGGGKVHKKLVVTLKK